jgi:PAS domain S-box-containing protein
MSTPPESNAKSTPGEKPAQTGRSEEGWSRPTLKGVTEEEWLRAIVDAADDAIISKDLSGTIMSWNPGAERLFGYKAGEIVGRSVTLLIPQDRLDEEPAIIERVRKGEHIEHYETSRQRKDGSLVEISLTISPIRNVEGEIVGAFKIAREISDRRALENATRKLAAIVDSSDDAIISKDLKGVIQSWNIGAERLFGYSASEMIGRSVTTLLPLGLRDEEPQILARIQKGERIDHYETVRRRKNGSLVNVSLTVSPIRDAVGQIIGASKIVRDVSDRRKGDEAARRLAAIVDSSDDAIISKNLDGVIQTWNDAAQRLFGYSRDEAVGRPVLMLIPEGRRDEEPAILARLRRGERIEHYETIRQRKDGSLVEVSLSVSPIRNEVGDITGASKIVRDISLQKQVQRELLMAHEKAIAANRAKDDFLAALSHELRTPLNPVLMIASEAAQNDGLPASVRADFESIRHNVELEARLIDDLLDLSRITNGKLQLRIGKHDLRAILRKAVATVQPDAEVKKQIIIANYSANPLAISGDPVRLQQVLWNVLKNAVKFTPEGGTVTLSTRINTVRGCAVVEIADTGRGILTQDLETIFDAFDRSAGSAKDAHRFGGLGLGLTISRKITELHHGSIRAMSDGPGTGSTFVVELPLARIEDEPFAHEARPASGSEASAKPVPEKMKILLVEDHDSSRVALSRLLSRRGYQVFAAANLADARAIAAKELLAFVISDIGLPDGDGAELIRELHEQHGLLSIALTGYGMENDILRCKEAGAVAHLIKPVSMVALEAALRTRELPPGAEPSS